MFSEEEVSSSHVFDSKRYLFFLISFFLAFSELNMSQNRKRAKTPAGRNEKKIFFEREKEDMLANMFQEWCCPKETSLTVSC